MSADEPPLSLLVAGAVLLGLLGALALYAERLDLTAREPDVAIQPIRP